MAARARRIVSVPQRDDLKIKPQLYNLDAIAYESLMVGFFTVWRGQPADRHKPNNIVLGYSRDGWHWSRPDRRAFCPVSDKQSDWNANNVQSAGGGFLVVGDELYFYVSGRTGRPGGNSGLQYRVTEDSKNPWDSGTEYQVLDNTRHEDGNNPLSSAGGGYAVYPPLKKMARPIGQWNRSRLVVLGNHVEHWLNGRKVVAYDLGSKEWLVHVKTSKFINSKTYGRAPRGHLCLQDYRFPIEFRNIKIRTLPAKDEK